MADFLDQIPPLREFNVPGTKRMLFVLGLTALGRQKAEELVESLKGKAGGGLNSPEVRADYLCDLFATPGQSILRDFNQSINIAHFTIPDKARHVISADFGGSIKSYNIILAAAILPRTTFVYYEHSTFTLGPRAVKERIRRDLEGIRKELKEAGNWDFGSFYEAIGDVTGVGYKLSYAEEPYPLYFGSPGDKTQEDWRSREANSSILNSLFSLANRCCFREWPDEAVKCDICGLKLERVPGIIIHPRCINLITQIPAYVSDEKGKPKEDAPRDAVDAALYLARYMQRTRRKVEAKEVRFDPWWMPAEVDKSPRPLAKDDEAQRAWSGLPSTRPDFWI